MGESLKAGAVLKLRSLRDALKMFDGHLTGEQIATFCEIAVDPGIGVSELSERMGYEQSTATRNADVLGAFGRGNKTGLRLVERRDATGDRRIRALHLTPKGVRLANQIARTLG